MTRVSLITGVAGGVGRATARMFAEAGWHVVGVDRRQADDLSGMKHFVHADISEPEAWDQILHAVSSNEGRLDALINNAAIQICKPLLETALEEWDTTMASNLRSVFLGVRQVYALLKEAGGAIVNVSSVHALATSVGIAAYAVSKGALVTLTRAMALEFAPDNVRVNAVLPGAVETPMLHAGLARWAPSAKPTAEPMVLLGQRHPLGRVARP